jgi:bla regulator protein BlaR1
MGTNLQQLLPENIAQALCRTLIHSLWQGLIMAILTGLVILFTRKSSAAKRYRWLVGILCLFTISFLFTLVTALNSEPQIDSITHNGGAGCGFSLAARRMCAEL